MATLTSNSKPVRVGKPGVYTDREGNQKAALVTATPDSINPKGTGVEAPQEGAVSLVYFSATGKTGERKNVPVTDEPGKFTFSR